jgi:hypothetical protein
MIDYTIFYKSSFKDGEVNLGEDYDLFFSGYDNCDRTKAIFGKINSTKKIWFNFPHYQLTEIQPDCLCDIFTNDSFKEDDFFIDYFSKNALDFSSRICIDITGFIRPHLIYFIKYLYLMGVKKMDFLYTEPHYYKNAEETTFSGFIDDVKLIEGCSSELVNPKTEEDILIITAGYDDKLIAKVSQSKSKIKNKYYILGFPSLQPDMYQESILKLYYAKESIGNINKKFAPAFDPFVTAQTIQDIINENPNSSNIYLSPLSTKPQTLGIALYYLWNFTKKPINIIFPYSKHYLPKTAIGIKKTWKYTFELP